MLSKKLFIDTINEIISVNKELDELGDVNPNAVNLIIDYSLQDTLIAVLEEAMNLPVDPKYGSTISWWIYDAKCGKSNPSVTFDKGTDKEQIFVLDTAEKLYDFCKQEGESNV